jgi:hypothetical protein
VAAWKLVAPADGKTTKTVSGKELLYCDTHKKWGQHKLEDCFLKKKRDGASTGQTSGGHAGPTPAARSPTCTPPPVANAAGSRAESTQRLTMSVAMAALLDEEEQDEGYVSYPSLLDYGAYATAINERAEPAKEVFTIFPATTFADSKTNGNGGIAFVATFDSEKDLGRQRGIPLHDQQQKARHWHTPHCLQEAGARNRKGRNQIGGHCPLELTTQEGCIRSTSPTLSFALTCLSACCHHSISPEM